ncbi:MAG: hypothetical protein K0S81_3291, partial [Rhodospirillales bacterium]|nr:hypothetical protein [Rhodospirillales bacterium]
MSAPIFRVARAPSVRRFRRLRALWPILPLLAFLLAVFLYPVAQLLAVSFTGRGGGFSLDLYGRLFSSSVYVQT